jgi:hypothetical protein
MSAITQHLKCRAITGVIKLNEDKLHSQDINERQFLVESLSAFLYPLPITNHPSGTAYCFAVGINITAKCGIFLVK